MGVNKLNASEGMTNIAQTLQGSGTLGAGVGMFGKLSAKDLTAGLNNLVDLSSKFNITGAEMQAYRNASNEDRGKMISGWKETRKMDDAGVATFHAGVKFTDNESDFFKGIGGKFDAGAFKKAGTDATMKTQMVNATIAKHIDEQMKSGGLGQSEKSLINALGAGVRNKDGSVTNYLDAKHLLMLKDGFDASGKAKNADVTEMLARIKKSGAVKMKDKDGNALSDQEIFNQADDEFENKMGLGSDIKQASGLQAMIQNVLKGGDPSQETPALLGNILEMIRSMTSEMTGIKVAIEGLKV
jgi:hypothetical protein